MEKKDLDISLAIPNSVVSRKHCGKFELRRQECPNFASQNIKPQNNKTLQSPTTPFKIVLGETSRNRRLSGSTLTESHPNRKATSLNPDTLAEIPHAALGTFKNMSGIILRR